MTLEQVAKLLETKLPEDTVFFLVTASPRGVEYAQNGDMTKCVALLQEMLPHLKAECAN